MKNSFHSIFVNASQTGGAHPGVDVGVLNELTQLDPVQERGDRVEGEGQEEGPGRDPRQRGAGVPVDGTEVFGGRD